MDFSLICDTYKQVLKEFNESAVDDPRFFSVNDLTENGCCYGVAIRTLGTTAFSYYYVGLHAGEISVSAELFDSIGLSTICRHSTVENDLTFIRFSSTSDAKLVFNRLFFFLTKNVKSEFNCCHLFHQCSDEKRCVNPYSHALFCEYRKKIESGIIYFGKNAESFDDNVYHEFLNWLKVLPDDVRSVFWRVIYFFVSKEREQQSDIVYGIVIKSSCLVKHVPASYHDSLSYVFSFSDPCLYALNDNTAYPRSKLQDVIKPVREKFQQDPSAPDEAKYIKLGGDGATNKEFINYIMKYCSAEQKKIRSAYSYAVINKELIQYINEYIYENSLFLDGVMPV